MYKVIFFLISITLICLSCNNEGYKETDRYMEIDNQDLKKELAFYVDSLDSIHKGEDYVIRVYCRDISNILKRYTISDEIDYDSWNRCPYNFKSKVHGKDILFVMWTANPRQSLAMSPVFKLDDKSFGKEVKKYFPKIYKKYGLKDSRYPQIIYEPDLIYLTFLGNKLIGKYVSRGLPGDHVPVNINKKIIYM